MQLGSFLVSGETMYSAHSIEPWVVCIVESCWSLANLCLLTFQRWEGSGNPAPKLGWKSAVWLGKSDLTDEHLVRTELHTREAYDDSPRTAGQKKTSVQLSKHHRSRRRRQRTSHLQLNLSLFLMHHKKNPKMRRRNQQENRRKMKKCNGRPVDTKEAPGVSSSGRSEKRTETQESVPV